MRLIECIGFHFPEFKRVVDDLDLYILLAHHLKNRQFMKTITLEQATQNIMEEFKSLQMESELNIKKTIINVFKAADISTGCDF